MRSRTASEAVLRVLDACRTKYQVKLLAYVLMPDHIHMAIWAERAEDVRRFIRQFLRASASEIASLADVAATRGNPTAALWPQRFRDRARQRARVRVWKERGRAFPVTEADALRQKLDYIHQNPVRRQLVERAEEWEFSSASWYAGGVSCVRQDCIDW